MSKNFIFKLLSCLILLAGAVLWLLSIAVPQTFGWFNSSFAVAIICGSLGMLLIFSGFFKKDIITIKKLNIWLGIGLLVITIYSLVSAFVIPKSITSPIVCIVIGLGLVLTIVATGGKKWDEGDNEKTDYKNYHQRKIEQERQDKDFIEK